MLKVYLIITIFLFVITVIDCFINDDGFSKGIAMLRLLMFFGMSVAGSILLYQVW